MRAVTYVCFFRALIEECAVWVVIVVLTVVMFAVHVFQVALVLLSEFLSSAGPRRVEIIFMADLLRKEDPLPTETKAAEDAVVSSPMGGGVDRIATHRHTRVRA